MPSRRDIGPRSEPQLFDGGEDEDFRAMLKPILAGARARGVADGLEMLGVGAVLIDAAGRVLHIGGRGRRMMGGWLRIVEDHIVAERPGDKRAVEDLVGGALAGRESRLELVGPSGESTFALKVLPFASDEGEAQRLHAVIVLEEPCGS